MHRTWSGLELRPGEKQTTIKGKWIRKLQAAEHFLHENVSIDGAKRAVDWVTHPRGSPLLKELKSNLKSGITVSMVSVPLSISLAIAGGGTPVMGITTAFWAGLMSALVGGSHFNVVGPTGALSGVLAAVSLKHGVEVLPFMAILAGLMGLLVWALKLDKWIMFLPASVIHGFTVGVALIIGFNQINSALGVTGLTVHEAFLQNLIESLRYVYKVNGYSLGLFLISISCLLLLVRKLPKVPWAIIFSGIGILLGWLSHKEYLGPIKLLLLQDKYPVLELELLKVPVFSHKYITGDVLSSAIAVVFVGILETLISAKIADGMTKSEHSPRRETLGFSIANIVCGACGGIPATAALARTALNIKSGATSRVSGIINAFAVLLISLVLLPLFKFIPMATVAALLVLVAIRMVDIGHLKHMYKFDKVQFSIAMISASMCVAIDTMAGILAGGIVALLMFTSAMSTGHTEIQFTNGDSRVEVDVNKLDEKEELDPVEGEDKTSLMMSRVDSEPNMIRQDSSASLDNLENRRIMYYKLNGPLNYINASTHAHRIQKIVLDDYIKILIICLRHCPFVDLDGIDVLQEMIQKAEIHNIAVLLVSVEAHEQQLDPHPFYQSLKLKGHVFESMREAQKFTPKSISVVIPLEDDEIEMM